MIEKNFGREMLVREVFDYCASHLDAKCTQYGGTAGMANIQGDTILAILGEREDGVLEHKYLINPHAGEFATATNQRTKHITVIPLSKSALSEEETRQALAGLK